jgi:hypothetical protein
MRPRIKQSVTFSSTADADAARRFYRRCQQLFGDGCTVTVRASTATTDVARQVPRGERLTQPST